MNTCCYLALLIAVPALAVQGDQTSRSRQIVSAACANESITEIARIAGMEIAAHSDVSAEGESIGWRASLDDGNDRFELQRLAPGGGLRGARLEWWRGGKPRLSISVDSECSIRVARRMVYDGVGRAIEVAHLDAGLNDTQTREPLNPAVPPGKSPKGVRVAMVDSGVNYLLPHIRDRLTRDAEGKIIGFDYWEMDERPFDANPARSPFFPQRHGTRTASMLLKEAPQASLVSYRYPRPDMSRMGDLVWDAAEKGVRIVGLPLGSKKPDDWKAFREAAGKAPQILFIASAGNRGIDLDQEPAYPAGLDLDNLVVVTSADDSGQPAEGSNWGADTVDLLVPAEYQITVDFSGNERIVSGSSYAVSRVAAMAARLLEKNPGWSAREIKNAIFAQAIRDGFDRFVAVGYIPDPLSDTSTISLLGKRRFDTTRQENPSDLRLDFDIVLLDGAGWHETTVENMVSGLGEILGQCEIRLGRVELHRVSAPERLLDFDVGTAHTLTTHVNVKSPAVYLVRDTLRQTAFDAEAFGRGNSGPRTWLTDTVWLTAVTDKPEIALGHELFHVLINSGEHVYAWRNLMHPRIQPEGWLLNDRQCGAARDSAVAAGLLSMD